MRVRRELRPPRSSVKRQLPIRSESEKGGSGAPRARDTAPLAVTLAAHRRPPQPQRLNTSAGCILPFRVFGPWGKTTSGSSARAAEMRASHRGDLGSRGWPRMGKVDPPRAFPPARPSRLPGQARIARPVALNPRLTRARGMRLEQAPCARGYLTVELLSNAPWLSEIRFIKFRFISTCSRRVKVYQSRAVIETDKPSPRG